jgi:D-sedoheptulose 7-phosphate isomerase
VGFTTSGRSPNVVNALAAAREAGAGTVLFGGGDGRPAADHADHALVVPSSSTARVQEMHVLLLHLILDEVDKWAAGGK